jgi:hypothetical protein
MNRTSINLRAFGLFALAVLVLLTVQVTSSRPSVDEAIKRAYGNLADSPWLAEQNKGDVATGVVVYEKDGKLYLDSEPCNKKFYNFSQPYEKTATGATVTCGSDSFPKFRVRQK